MLINWFTVVAQIINFLILVWLLKRFLYKPIMKAIEERERKIAAQLRDAEAKKAEAATERDEFEKKNREFDQQRNIEWQKAVEQVSTERQRLAEEALKESNALRSKLQDTLQEEQDKLSRTIARKTQEEVFAIARKTLEELANESLEDSMITVFIHRLKALKEEQKQRLVAALLPSNTTINVTSAFDLTAIQKQEIEKAVKALLGNIIAPNFRTAPELISGIELNANGYKLAWSISEYLDSIKRIISELGNEKSKPVKESEAELRGGN
jgi:F-type H+-transporting ATPase subunit b